MPKKPALRRNEESRYVTDPDLAWEDVKKRLNLQSFFNNLSRLRRMQPGTYNPEPKAERPTLFQPDPFVVGDPWEATIAQKLIDQDPYVKKHTGTVFNTGPEPALRKVFASRAMNPQSEDWVIGDLDDSNLAATYNRWNNDINISPDLGQHEFVRTLLHELAHAGGARDFGNFNAYKVVDELYGKR